MDPQPAGSPQRYPRRDSVCPAAEIPLARQLEGVEPAGRNGYDAGQARRDIDLALRVVAPRDHRSVSLERQAEARAGDNRHGICEAGRHIRLAVEVVAPGYDRPVALEGHAMSSTG